MQGMQSFVEGHELVVPDLRVGQPPNPLLVLQLASGRSSLTQAYNVTCNIEGPPTFRKTLASLFCFILLSKPHKAAKERKEHKEYKHTRYDRHKGNIFERKHVYILRSSD